MSGALSPILSARKPNSGPHQMADEGIASSAEVVADKAHVAEQEIMRRKWDNTGRILEEAQKNKLDPEIPIIVDSMVDHFYSNYLLLNNTDMNRYKGIFSSKDFDKIYKDAKRVVSCSNCIERLFLDSAYLITRRESELFNQNQGLVDQVRDLANGRRIVFVSIGCGPSYSVESKDCTIVRGLGAEVSIGIDSNPFYADMYPLFMKKNNSGVTCHGVTQDFFEEKLKIKKFIEKNDFLVFSFLGDTIAQFECTKENIKDSALYKLAKNFNLSARGHDAVLFATTDTLKDEAATEQYRAKPFVDLIDAFNLQTRAMVDPKFDHRHWIYKPVYIDDRVYFTQTLTGTNQITPYPGGKTYHFDWPLTIAVGYSQKMCPEKLFPTLYAAGLRPIKPSIHTTSATGVILAANDKLARKMPSLPYCL
ncbi:MAG: L-histidine N(alpha)-methyltransferase [Alphaproteobacteria bacterium]|nr:L-histidine N(alpha)-methyltransferase [Alphaproteobacteria bacterium]